MSDIKPSMLVEELLKERREVTLNILLNSNADFNRLREKAKQMNDYDSDEYGFNVSGTDAELWESVNDYFKKYEPQKEFSKCIPKYMSMIIICFWLI